jgi:putative oxidoreductase
MEVGLLVLHVTVGVFLAAHGSQKLFGWLGGFGIRGTGGYLESLGLRHGAVLAAAAGSSETVGGSLLALGLLTPFAAALIAGTMLVAARTDHRGKGFWIYAGGGEYVLTNAVVALALAFNGPGTWSLDASVGWSLNGVWWGAGTALAAVAGAAGVLAVFRRRPAAVAEPAAASSSSSSS